MLSLGLLDVCGFHGRRGLTDLCQGSQGLVLSLGHRHLRGLGVSQGCVLVFLAGTSEQRLVLGLDRLAGDGRLFQGQRLGAHLDIG